MKFDPSGRLQTAEEFDKNGEKSMQKDHAAVLNRLKQNRIQQKDIENDITDTISTASNSCRVVERLKREQRGKHRSRSSVSSSVSSGNHRGGSNKRLLKYVHPTQLMSINEFAGFSPSSKKDKSKDDCQKKKKQGWFGRRKNRVADGSSVPSQGTNTNGDSTYSKGCDTVSILRNKIRDPSDMGSVLSSTSSAVRFAEGTNFVEKRGRVPRIRRDSHRSRRKKRDRLPLTRVPPAKSPNRIMTIYEHDGGCNPIEEMAPLVNAVVTATTTSMGCHSVFR